MAKGWTWKPRPIRLGPLRFNISKNGLTSISMKTGPVSQILWAKNGRRGVSSIDGPGSMNFQRNGGRSNNRNRAGRRNEEGSVAAPSMGMFGNVGAAFGALVRLLFTGMLVIGGLLGVGLLAIMTGIIGG